MPSLLLVHCINVEDRLTGASDDLRRATVATHSLILQRFRNNSKRETALGPSQIMNLLPFHPWRQCALVSCDAFHYRDKFKCDVPRTKAELVVVSLPG